MQMTKDVLRSVQSDQDLVYLPLFSYDLFL